MQWQVILLCILCAVICTVSITLKRFKKIDNLWLDRAICISQGLVISVPLISTVVTKDDIEQRILMALGVVSAFSIPIYSYIVNSFNALFARKNYIYLDPSTSAEHKYGLIIGMVIGLIIIQLNQLPDATPNKTNIQNIYQYTENVYIWWFIVMLVVLYGLYTGFVWYFI